MKMANNKSSLGAFLIILFSFLIKSGMSQLAPALFIFGDSLTDVGNNVRLIPAPIWSLITLLPQYGIDYPSHRGRWSNGKNIADFLAEKVGVPSPPPYLSLSPCNATAFMAGVSFASAGAGILNTSGSESESKQLLSMTDQVGYYESVTEKLVEEVGSSAAENLLSNSLFAVIMGNNDVQQYNKNTSGTPQQYVDLVIATLKELTKRIYDHGGRKFFFSGVPPIGCAPMKLDRSTGAYDTELNGLIFLYNQNLKSLLRELSSELIGFSYSYFDSYALFQIMLEIPDSYGFTNVNQPCCTLNIPFITPGICTMFSSYCHNRTEYLFWDFIHPTEAACKIIVDTLFDGSWEYTYPVNVRKLLDNTDLFDPSKYKLDVGI